MDNNKEIKMTTGQSRFSTNWILQKMLWSDFIKKLSMPVITNETFAVFIQLKKPQQDNLKDVGGFIAGSLKDNRRKAENIIDRCIVTLDADNIAPGGTQNVLKRVSGLGCAYAIYSTRKHCSEKPRLRILIPLDRDVTPDEYGAVSRKLASFIGLEIMDSSTFEPARLMYWPSHSKDSEFVFTYEDKPFANVDGILAMYQNWKDTNEWPKLESESEVIKKEIQRQKDPLVKDNIVGAFCKVYDIHSAIETFLNDIYIPGTYSDKYTYKNGSVANGAHVYNDSKFLYSFHETDPASRKLCNSFDLVRIHRFGELDNDFEVKNGTKNTEYPSFKAMCTFALEDIGVAGVHSETKYAKAVEEFQILNARAS